MMDFRLDPSMVWQALLILCAVMRQGQTQFPPTNGATPVLDQTPVVITTELGKTVKLPCHILNEGSQGATWMYGDYELISEGSTIKTTDPRFSVETIYNDEWNLVIKSVRSGDAGLYNCMASSFPPQIKPITLTIFGKPSIDRSAVDPEYTLKEGDSLQVECVATGYPEPSVKWYKDSTDPSSLKKKELLSSTNILTIGSLKRADNNIYGCEAKNEYGSDVYEIFVYILFKPELSTATRNVRVEKGESVKLRCIVDSNPTAKAAWYRNNRILYTSWKYHVNNDNDNLQSETKRTMQLTIREVDMNDSGVYYCKATNKLGKAELPINLTVLDTPTTTTTMSTSTTEIIKTTQSTTTTNAQTTKKVAVIQPSTPLAIEEPRTDESTDGGPSCRQYSKILISTLVLLVALLLS